MIARYTRPEMGAIWTDQGRLERWLEVEFAATDTLAERGVVPREAAARIRERARVDAARVLEIEARVRHDVIAFTLAVGESIGDPEAARWLHYGLTSNDVVDTAQALQVREASRLIEAGLKRLGEVLEKRAHEFQHTPQIGRTHGIHAEPITFGLKIANWFAENRRNQERFRHAARQMAVGKISGAVGNAAHLGVEVEEAICRRLGLEPAPVSFAGDPARPARRITFHAGDHRRDAGENRARDPPFAAHRSARSRRALCRRAARQLGHAAQAQSGKLRADLPAWRAWCAPMRRRRSKMSRSGTSATFRTARSSASSCRIPPF